MDDRIGRVRSVFDEWAQAGRAEGMEKGHGAAARRGFAALDLPPDGRYLDVGCGNGYTVRWAARAAPSGVAHGIDVSERMIARARERSADLPNARFAVAAFPDEPAFEPASFDAIFSMEVFYYLPDLDAALARTRELLRPGGRFACIVDYYAENPASSDWPDQLGVEMTRLDASGWRSALERAGFAIVRQERLRLDPGEASEPWKATHGSLFTLGRALTRPNPRERRS